MRCVVIDPVTMNPDLLGKVRSSEYRPFNYDLETTLNLVLNSVPKSQGDSEERSTDLKECRIIEPKLALGSSFVFTNNKNTGSKPSVYRGEDGMT